MPSEYQMHENCSTIPSIRKIFSNNESVCKYRNIPVTKTSDILETPGAFHKNTSGVKEEKNTAGLLKRNAYYFSTISKLKYKFVSGTSNQRLKVDNGVYASRRKFYPGRNFLDRRRRGSVSEPTLSAAKGRGDNAALLDMYGENCFFPNKHFGDVKPVAQKEPYMKGCIYIKKAGKVLKSSIEAKCIPTEADNVFCNRKKKQIPKLKNSTSKGKLATLFGTKNLKVSCEEEDDFEIAVFLSGLNGCTRKGKKKKHNDRKNKDKNFEMIPQGYQSSPKEMRNNTLCTDRSNITYKVSKSDINLNSSSKEFDSNSLYDGSEKILKRKSKRTSDNPSFATNCSGRHRPLMSEYSISPYSSDLYGIPKVKIRDGELWRSFEILFNSYSSTSRHSGLLISKKISVEWMMNVGVVDELITVEEAGEAFKHAAGPRVTMNAHEFKEFLIMLALRMKLPFYEIYRRMCGM